MQEWFIYALLSIFVIAGSEISQKISLTQKVDISAITNNFFVWIFQGTGGIILSLIFGGISFALNISDILRLTLVAITYFLGGTFYYTSYKGNSPSISIILGSISVIISTFLGIIFFDESTHIQKFIGIGIILVSIIIVNLKKKEKFGKYNLFALLGGVCFGVAYNIDKSFIQTVSPFNYLILMCFSVAIASFIFKPKLILKEVKKLSTKNFYPMIFAATFGTLFNLFTFLSYDKGGNVGIIDAMNNSSMFLVIAMEIIILKDKSSLFKKITSAILVVFGIYLLSSIS
jgi:drug/metabolite transporter (DMT)-like permease